jgi:hypothetical protein
MTIWTTSANSIILSGNICRYYKSHLLKLLNYYTTPPCEMSEGKGVRNTAHFSFESPSITISCGRSH